MTKIIHPVAFVDKLMKTNELGQLFTLMDHQREVLRLAFDFDKDGSLRGTRSLFLHQRSTPDNFGWALMQESAELLILANDREQALSPRIFAAIED